MHDIPQLSQHFFMTICCLLTLVPKRNHAKHTHQQSCTICINNSVTIWRRCSILQDRHHCMLSAAKAAIWQVSCMLTSPPSHSSLHRYHVSLSLSLSLCLSFPVFISQSHPRCQSISTSYSPLQLCITPILHLYLPVHPPPSRPGSHTEISTSVKIEDGLEERKE